jgi:hypothetical protein
MMPLPPTRTERSIVVRTAVTKRPFGARYRSRTDQMPVRSQVMHPARTTSRPVPKLTTSGDGSSQILGWPWLYPALCLRLARRPCRVDNLAVPAFDLDVHKATAMVQTIQMGRIAQMSPYDPGIYQPRARLFVLTTISYAKVKAARCHSIPAICRRIAARPIAFHRREAIQPAPLVSWTSALISASPKAGPAPNPSAFLWPSIPCAQVQ